MVMLAAGHEQWSRSTVSEVERVGRSVSVDELVSLAACLEVTPADLLDPTGPDGRRTWPLDLGAAFGTIRAATAQQWVRGGQVRPVWGDEPEYPDHLETKED